MRRNNPKFLYGRSPGIYLPTPKPKKTFKFPFRAVRIFFLLVIFAGFFYLFFLSPAFLINKVNVKGTSNLEIINITQTAYNKNLWLYNKKKFEEELLKFAEISEVKITRWPPKTLKIQILEKKEGILWLTQGRLYLLSENGFVIKEVIESESTKNLPKVMDAKNVPVILGKQLLTDAFVKFIKELLAQFNQRTGLKLVEINVPESTFEIWVKTETIYLKMDPQGDLAIQLDYFIKAWEQKKDEIKEYVDLTTWDKGIVVYK